MINAKQNAIKLDKLKYTLKVWNIPVYDKLHALETLYDSRIHFLNFSCE